MILIIGLGNPGKKYSKTRHNLGFRVIDEFGEKNNFPDFKLLKKINALVSKNTFSGKEIILAKPQTFMNNSGKSVKALTDYYKSEDIDIIVVHDDIDILLGEIKIAQNRGSAGHKGVQSIIDELKTKNFTRISVGIKPQQFHRLVYGTEVFVLEKFTKDEEKIIKEAVEKAVGAIETIKK